MDLGGGLIYIYIGGVLMYIYIYGYCNYFGKGDIHTLCSSVACRRSPFTWFTAPAREKTVFLPIIFSVVLVLIYSL